MAAVTKSRNFFNLSDTILKGDHPKTIPAKFALTWFSGFRGEDLNVIFYQNMPNLHNRRPMFFCQKTFNYICLCCSFMSITHVEYVLIWLFKYITDVYIIDFPYSISCTRTFLVPYLENIQSSKIYKRFSYCDLCIFNFQLVSSLPKRNKLAEKISQKNLEYMLSYSLPYSCS
jgi:hypothetical protein